MLLHRSREGGLASRLATTTRTATLPRGQDMGVQVVAMIHTDDSSGVMLFGAAGSGGADE